MKRTVSLFLVSVFASAAFCQDWNWQDIGRHAQAGYAQFELSGSVQSISVVRYRASRYTTHIVNDPAEMADSTSALAQRHGALGAINGSYFDVKALTPATYVVDDRVQEGRTVQAEEYRTDGVVAVRGRHKVMILPKAPERCREVLASGPLLLQGGSPVREEWPQDSFFSSRHPRTVMGIKSDGWVYFVVIDGRSRGQAAGVTIPEAVQVALMLGLDDAINLDGGGSSTLWCEGLGVISHPCDNRKFNHYGQRAVPNIVMFK